MHTANKLYRSGLSTDAAIDNINAIGVFWGVKIPVKYTACGRKSFLKLARGGWLATQPRQARSPEVNDLRREASELI